MKRHDCALIVLSLATLLGTIFLAGCGGTADASLPSAHATTSTHATTISLPLVSSVSNLRVSNRKANLTGRILVTEYHHILDRKGPMYRSPSAFRKDLSAIYKLGFRPVTVSEYLANRMALPPGASPVIFTFDDSNPTQIKFSSSGELDPNCAMGIWAEFAKTHPDFPPKATFYVLPDAMWMQPKWIQKKIEWVRKNGGELGNHTMTHPKLSHLSDDAVKKEIGEAELRLAKLGEPIPSSLALPFGISPKNRSLLAGFTYRGHKIEPKCVFLAGAEPSRAINDKKWNKLRVPRVQACTGDSGLDDWLEQIKKGRVRLYVAQ